MTGVRKGRREERGIQGKITSVQWSGCEGWMKEESMLGLKLKLRRNKMTVKEVKVEDQSSKEVSSFLQQMNISLSWRKINLTKKRLLQPLQFEDQGGNQKVFW